MFRRTVMYNEQELIKRIEDLESRIAALEGECENCPECDEEPCVCDEDDEVIDDVDAIEELDFDTTSITSDDDSEEDEENPYF